MKSQKFSNHISKSQQRFNETRSIPERYTFSEEGNEMLKTFKMLAMNATGRSPQKISGLNLDIKLKDGKAHLRCNFKDKSLVNKILEINSENDNKLDFSPNRPQGDCCISFLYAELILQMMSNLRVIEYVNFARTSKSYLDFFQKKYCPVKSYIQNNFLNLNEEDKKFFLMREFKNNKYLRRQLLTDAFIQNSGILTVPLINTEITLRPNCKQKKIIKRFMLNINDETHLETFFSNGSVLANFCQDENLQKTLVNPFRSLTFSGGNIIVDLMPFNLFHFSEFGNDTCLICGCLCRSNPNFNFLLIKKRPLIEVGELYKNNICNDCVGIYNPSRLTHVTRVCDFINVPTPYFFTFHVIDSKEEYFRKCCKEVHSKLGFERQIYINIVCFDYLKRKVTNKLISNARRSRIYPKVCTRANCDDYSFDHLSMIHFSVNPCQDKNSCTNTDTNHRNYFSHPKAPKCKDGLHCRKKDRLHLVQFDHCK